MPPPSSSSFPILRLLAAAASVAALASAQEVKAVAGTIAPAPAAPASSDDDPGVAVDMFENANLDRYLRAARKCFDREDYAQAIKLLQAVVEGNTSVVNFDLGDGDKPAGETPPAPTPPPAPAEPAKPDKQQEAKAKLALAARRTGGANGPVPDNEPKAAEIDARNAVFSQDGRLYRPVARLCHEMIAHMPAVGIEIYRAKFEVLADEMLQQALADGTTQSLEHVVNRYFVTLPAGRAMALLADRLMHEGRYRAAVLVLKDLLDTYPADNRKRLAISEVWCRFKIALCLALAGEGATAHEAVTTLATTYTDESLRVQGELYAVKDLPTDQLFARDVAAIPTAPTVQAGSVLDAPDVQLIPLWQYRFKNPEPYKDPKPANDRNQVFFNGEGAVSMVMPFASRYGPATWVAFGGSDASGLPQALFFEHFRLRAADATSGLLLQQADGADEPPVVKDMQPRLRVAATDFALLRPVFDGERCYTITGRASTGQDALKVSELRALRPDNLQQIWSSTQWHEGDGGLRDVTLLAAPTVFGERLLLPALRRGKYCLECLDRQTGQPLWSTPIHGGGTPFFKAPGCPVVVVGGVAFVATNAGCVASIDAFTGDLRWTRRYERVDAAHRRGKTKKPARGDEMMGWQGVYRQEALETFHPSDVLAHNGLVIVAPCDGEVLFALDGATGQPQWMLDGTTSYAPYGKLRGVVGIVGDVLFAVSESSAAQHLVAIEASGGLVKWARELPAWNGPKNSGRGRGTIAGDRVLIPGDREVLAFTVDGKLAARVPLPGFDNREPLVGSVQLVANGPWLAVGYQGGIEMYSTAKMLRQLADRAQSASRKADLLVRAGELDGAIEVLRASLRATTDVQLRRSFGRELLALVRERAGVASKPGDCSEGLQVLDRFADLLAEPDVRLMWHLARVELCKERGDLLAHEREQNRLYAYMEGKG